MTPSFRKACLTLLTLAAIVVVSAGSASAATNAAAVRSQAADSGNWKVALSTTSGGTPTGAVSMGSGDLLGLSQGKPIYVVHYGTLPFKTTSNLAVTLTASGLAVLARTTLYACNGTWNATYTACNGTLATVASTSTAGSLPAFAVPAVGTSTVLVAKSASLLSGGSVQISLSATR